MTMTITYRGNDFVDLSNPSDHTETDKTPLSVSYGQQLGYNRRKGNNTWHYSLGHTWFQLNKRNYNVMISAEVIYVKN